MAAEGLTLAQLLEFAKTRAAPIPDTSAAPPLRRAVLLLARDDSAGSDASAGSGGLVFGRETSDNPSMGSDGGGGGDDSADRLSPNGSSNGFEITFGSSSPSNGNDDEGNAIGNDGRLGVGAEGGAAEQADSGAVVAAHYDEVQRQRNGKEGGDDEVRPLIEQ